MKPSAATSLSQERRWIVAGYVDVDLGHIRVAEHSRNLGVSQQLDRRPPQQLDGMRVGAELSPAMH